MSILAWLSLADTDVIFQNGGLSIVASYAGCGKTSFLANLCCSIMNDKRVLFFTNAHSTLHSVFRILAIKHNLNINLLFSDSGGEVDRLEKSLEKENIGEIIEKNVIIQDLPNPHIQYVYKTAHELHKEKPIDAILFDDIGLVRTLSDGSNYQLAETMSELKLIARELSVPLIATHQLSRTHITSAREPLLHDLSGSASVEQIADMVLFIVPQKETEYHHSGQIRVMKDRYGKRGYFYYDTAKKTNKISLSDFYVSGVDKKK